MINTPRCQSCLHKPHGGIPLKKRFYDATFYAWRKKSGGMAIPEVKRLKSLEEENARLRKLLPEAMLDQEALHVDLGRKY